MSKVLDDQYIERLENQVDFYREIIRVFLSLYSNRLID